MPAVDDLKALDRLEQVVLVAGVLAFFLSFFHFLTVSVSGVAGALAGIGGYGHQNAWHGWGLLGMLLVIVATTLAAVRVLSPASIPTIPVGVNLSTSILSGLGFLFLLIHGLSSTKSAGAGTFKVSVHMGVAGWLLLFVVLVQAGAAFMLFRKSEEVLPDFKAMTANKNAAGAAPATPPATPYPPSTPTTTQTPAGDFTLDDHPAEPPAPSV